MVSFVIMIMHDSILKSGLCKYNKMIHQNTWIIKLMFENKWYIFKMTHFSSSALIFVYFKSTIKSFLIAQVSNNSKNSRRNTCENSRFHMQFDQRFRQNFSLSIFHLHSIGWVKIKLMTNQTHNSPTHDETKYVVWYDTWNKL